MDRGAWQVMVHRVAKSLKWVIMHTHTHTHTHVHDIGQVPQTCLTIWFLSSKYTWSWMHFQSPVIYHNFALPQGDRHGSVSALEWTAGCWPSATACSGCEVWNPSTDMGTTLTHVLFSLHLSKWGQDASENWEWLERKCTWSPGL